MPGFDAVEAGRSPFAMTRVARARARVTSATRFHHARDGIVTRRQQIMGMQQQGPDCRFCKPESPKEAAIAAFFALPRKPAAPVMAPLR
jgi:hypothetical protein